jgi:hypothetical protein
MCDNQLPVKPTHAGNECINDPIEATLYVGVKTYLLIEYAFEDQDISGLVYNLRQADCKAGCRCPVCGTTTMLSFTIINRGGKNDF